MQLSLNLSETQRSVVCRMHTDTGQPYMTCVLNAIEISCFAESFRTTPSEENRARLQQYIDKYRIPEARLLDTVELGMSLRELRDFDRRRTHDEMFKSLLRRRYSRKNAQS